MTDDAFLAAVLAEPRADAPRLVYADWLDEHDDPRAEFLRLEDRLRKLSRQKKRSRPCRRRLEELALELDPDWVALVRRLRVKDAIEAALARLETLLYGYNYGVYLAIHRVPAVPGATPEQYIRAALGPNASARVVRPIPEANVPAGVESCLRHRGDEGSGPIPAVLRSPEYHWLVRQVLVYLWESVAEATAVATFWPGEGPRFDPVWWGFAYVLVKSRCAVVFVGSSSD